MAIIAILAAMGFCAISIASAQLQSCPATPDTDVLILGAGMAGIAAAKTLNDRGISDFIILEAQDRIGGRMANQEFAGVKVELGANWIQQIDNRTAETRNKHPIWALSQQCFPGGLQGQFTDYTNVVVYNEQQENITVRAVEARNSFSTAFFKLQEIIQKRIKNNEPDISVRQALKELKWNPINSLQQWVEWFYFDFCAGETPDVSSLYGYLNASYSAQDPDDLGGIGNLADYFITDQRGYGSLVQCLADDFMRDEKSEGRLHLNANVSRIEWSDECVCAVAYENRQVKRYCARYAILTFSIGVLKSKIVEFVPKLPTEKIEIINKFDMVNYLKVFLEFDKIFWQRDSSFQYTGHVSSRRGDYPIFHPLNNVLPNNPKLMLATLIEGIANETVLQPESEVKAKVTEVLRNLYGENAQEPVDILLPGWQQNPAFYGMYSNVLVGGNNTKLGSTLGRLYFSGEATSHNASGYVHGAYYTGVESARSVMDHMLVVSAAMHVAATSLAVIFSLLLNVVVV